MTESEPLRMGSDPIKGLGDWPLTEEDTIYVGSERGPAPGFCDQCGFEVGTCGGEIDCPYNAECSNCGLIPASSVRRERHTAIRYCTHCNEDLDRSATNAKGSSDE